MAEGKKDKIIHERAFAISLVQKLSPYFPVLQHELDQHFPQGMTCYVFVKLFRNLLQIRKLEQSTFIDENDYSVDEKEVDDKPVRSVINAFVEKLQKKPQIMNASDHKVKMFDMSMRTILDRKTAHHKNDTVKWFNTGENETTFSLWEIFVSVNIFAKPLVKWADIVAYLIDSSLQLKVESDDHGKMYKELLSKHFPIMIGVRAVVYLQDVDLFVLLSSQHEIRLVEPEKYTKVKVIPCSEDWGKPIHACLVPEPFPALAVAFGDGNVRLLDVLNWAGKPVAGKGSEVKFKNIHFATSQTFLFWGNKRKRLYCGSRVGLLTCVAKGTTIELEVQVHDGVITCIVELPLDGRLCTSSLDGMIHVLDPEKLVTLQSMSSGKGVLCIAYNPGFNLLITVGIESNIHMWMIGVNNTSSMLLRDNAKPHTTTVSFVHSIPKSSQIVTMDNRGLTKIWDLRNFQCTQSFVLEGDRPSNKISFHTVYVSTRRWILTISSNNILHIWDYNPAQQKSASPHAATEFPISSFVHNVPKNTISVLSKKDVIVYDITSGVVIYEIVDPLLDELISICVNTTGSSLFLGSLSGKVARYSTGTAQQTALTTVNTEVTGLVYVPQSKLIVVVCWTAEVFTIADLPGKEMFECVRLVYKNRPLEAVACCGMMEFLVLGKMGGNAFVLWEAHLKKTLLEAENTPSEIAVQAVFYFDEISCVLTTDVNGGIHMWSFDHSTSSFSLVTRWVSFRASINSPIVKHIEYHGAHEFLYVGDDTGLISIYDMRRTLETYTMHKGMGETTTPSPTLLKIWRAHSEAITGLKLMKSSNCIMSSSLDCTLHLWTSSGELLSYFAYRPNSDYRYKYNPDQSDEYLTLPEDFRDPNAKKFIEYKQEKKFVVKPSELPTHLRGIAEVEPEEEVPVEHHEFVIPSKVGTVSVEAQRRRARMKEMQTTKLMKPCEAEHEVTLSYYELDGRGEVAKHAQAVSQEVRTEKEKIKEYLAVQREKFLKETMPPDAYKIRKTAELLASKLKRASTPPEQLLIADHRDLKDATDALSPTLSMSKVGFDRLLRAGRAAHNSEIHTTPAVELICPDIGFAEQMNEALQDLSPENFHMAVSTREDEEKSESMNSHSPLLSNARFERAVFTPLRFSCGFKGKGQKRWRSKTVPPKYLEPIQVVESPKQSFSSLPSPAVAKSGAARKYIPTSTLSKALLLHGSA